MCCSEFTIVIDTAAAKMTLGSLPASCYYLSFVMAALIVVEPVPTSAIPVGNIDQHRSEYFHNSSPFTENGVTSELDKSENIQSGQPLSNEETERQSESVASPHFLSTGDVAKRSPNLDETPTPSSQQQQQQQSKTRRQRRSRDYSYGDADDDVSAEQDDASASSGKEHHGRASLLSPRVVAFSRLDLQRALAAVEDEIATEEGFRTRPPAVERRNQDSSKRSVLGRQTALGQLFLKRIAGKDLGGSWNGSQKGWASNNVRIWG